MSKPSLPDPVAAALRVKDIARDLASDVTEGYRKSNRFLRLRAAIVGAWGLLALVSLLVAFHSSTRDMRASLTDTPLVGRVLSVNNTSDDNWTEVTLTLEGGWTHFERTIRGGQNVGILITKFTKDGVAAPADLNPRWVEIDCSQLDDRIDLTRR
jgi:hypothetical protein